MSEVERAVRPLLQQGRLIEAIRQVREQTAMGLKEAKGYVDGLRIDDRDSS